MQYGMQKWRQIWLTQWAQNGRAYTMSESWLRSFARIVRNLFIRKMKVYKTMAMKRKTIIKETIKAIDKKLALQLKIIQKLGEMKEALEIELKKEG